MALELKDALTCLGIDIDPATAKVEDFKTAVDAKFITLDEATKNPDIMKKAVGSFGFEVNDALKKEFGLEKSEIKDLPTKEIVQFAAKKLMGKIKELEDSAGKGVDEKVKELTGKIEKLQGVANQYKSDLDKTAGELETEKTNFSTKLKGFKVQNLMKDAKSKLAWSEQATEVSKRGFDAIISDKYVIEVGDDDAVSILDKAGKKIPHPKKTGTYLGIDEVMDMELESAGLKKKNNLDPKQKFAFKIPVIDGGGTGKRVVAPAAQKSLENK